MSRWQTTWWERHGGSVQIKLAKLSKHRQMHMIYPEWRFWLQPLRNPSFRDPTIFVITFSGNYIKKWCPKWSTPENLSRALEASTNRHSEQIISICWCFEDSASSTRPRFSLNFHQFWWQMRPKTTILDTWVPWRLPGGSRSSKKSTRPVCTRFLGLIFELFFA